jgi:release factor glutamine methyltransferase
MFSKIRTLKEAYQNFKLLITKVYEPEEAETITAMVFKEVLGYDRIKLILNENDLLSASLFEQLDFISFQLLQHQPIQYILGYSYFNDLKFTVNKNVLIPRPETVDLVHLILKNHDLHTLDIIDIGTGSACIPICLKKERSLWNVTGLDISAAALQVAALNVKQHAVNVSLIEENIFEYEPNQKFDLIVSNPPYVLESEKMQMHKNVLDYEPSLALFVADQEPLKYYERITEIAQQYLNPNGFLYFEINESFAAQTQALLAKHCFEHIQIIQDFKGKNRFVSAQKI